MPPEIFESDQVPAGFFPRLVVKFFQWCTEEVPSQVAPQFFHNFARFYILSDEGVSVVLLCHSSSIEVIFLGGNPNLNLALAGSSKLNLSAEFCHDTTDMTSACIVRSQLALMIDGMRNEFCWLKDMRCEMSFLCPVCCQQGSVNYCRNHHVQYCKQEECLHFFSESELYRSKEVIMCTRSATAQDNRVHVKQFAPWFAFLHEKVSIQCTLTGSLFMDTREIVYRTIFSVRHCQSRLFLHATTLENQLLYYQHVLGEELTLSLPESNLESINVVVVCDHSNESY